MQKTVRTDDVFIYYRAHLILVKETTSGYIWDGNVRMASKQEKYMEWLQNELKHHKGKWLTYEVVASYRKRALNLNYGNKNLVGERRKLCHELMEEYGVTELEAFNILNGYGGQDYVSKYERIRTLTPLIVEEDIEKKIEDEWKKLRRSGFTDQKDY